MNFYYPYQIMVDIGKGYHCLDEGKYQLAEAPTFILIKWWWGLWLSVSVLPIAFQALVIYMNFTDSYFNFSALLTEVLYVVCGFVLIQIMQRISAREDSVYQKSQAWV